MSDRSHTPLDEAAFPRVGYETPTDGWVSGQQGMTLRDYFAAKVLQGFAANPAIFASNPQSGWALVNCTDSEIVQYAYKLAGEAVKAREHV